MLTYSNTKYGTICFSESLEVGEPTALRELGGSPRRHRTDRCWRRCIRYQHRDQFTRRYQALLGRYGVEAEHTGVACRTRTGTWSRVITGSSGRWSRHSFCGEVGTSWIARATSGSFAGDLRPAQCRSEGAARGGARRAEAPPCPPAGNAAPDEGPGGSRTPIRVLHNAYSVRGSAADEVRR